MPHWKLTLAYDGTAYHGWQVQPGLPTIQGVLAEALHRITGETVLPQGSGRTDAGVHALAQVASVSLETPIPPGRLLRTLNRVLPGAIRVLAAEHAPAGFHARHSAVRKTYQYRIFPLFPGVLTRRDAEPRICPPMLAPFVWACHWPLSLEALNLAAAHVLGAHDFTAFAAVNPDQTARNAAGELPPIDNLRTIHHSHWHQSDDGLVVYTVTGSGFLHHMVRNLVGTFVQAGSGRLDPASIPSILASRDRGLCGPTAPPNGLFLLQVDYPDTPSAP